MAGKKEQKSIYREDIRYTVWEMMTQLERHLVSAELYDTLQTELASFQIFKVYLDWVCSSADHRKKMPLHVRLIHGISTTWLTYNIRKTSPEEYIYAACMYIDSMRNLEEYIKGWEHYDKFTSMEDLLPNWYVMKLAFNAAMYQLLDKADHELAMEWLQNREEFYNRIMEID